MFHNTSSSAFGPSLGRTPGRSATMIHNDENIMPLSSSMSMRKKGLGHSSKKNAALKPLHVNINANNVGKGSVDQERHPSKYLKTSSSSIANPKTPSNGSGASNSRRRALGDISNRKKGTGGGGIGRTDKNTSNHKVKNVSLQQQQQPLNHSQVQGVSTQVKKKIVSFAIHATTDDLEDNDTRHGRRESKSLVSGGRSSTATGKSSRLSGRRPTLHDVEDIEIMAGRSGFEERALLENDIDLFETPLDIAKTLDDIRAIEEFQREQIAKGKLMQKSSAEVERQYQEKINGLYELEDVDDMNCPHLMDDEKCVYDDDDFSLDFGDDNGDDDSLLAGLDDLFI